MLSSRSSVSNKASKQQSMMVIISDEKQHTQPGSRAWQAASGPSGLSVSVRIGGTIEFGCNCSLRSLSPRH